jgi:osmoprotectant transport system substrate-binding protein
MKHRPVRTACTLLLPLALLAGACGDDDDEAADTGTTTTEATEGGTGDGGGGEACDDVAAPADAPSITIGAQNFGESKILAEMYGQCLEAAGFEVEIQQIAGFRDLELTAFDAGDINVAPEYAASMLEDLNGEEVEATNDAAETTDLLNQRLAELGLEALEPSDAVNTNVFVVTEETAQELDLQTISDLADHAGDLTLGAPADCETNPFCLPGLQRVYGIDLGARFTALETGSIPPALTEGAIDVAVLFSTDARLATEDWVVLEDDQGMLAADNIVPVVTSELAGIDEVVELADRVSATLTTEGMTELNRRFDVDVEDPEDIAASHLEDAGLL